MISTNYDKGMIFLCNDKCSKSEFGSKHNYLIIGVQGNSELGYVQTMGITSMRSKEVLMEVPIKLCNDYVSYVVPYNIHSFRPEEIRITNFKGCIIDTPRISKTEFLTLLTDIYLDSLGLKDHDEVLTRYNSYCKSFWTEFKDVKEFRTLEEERDSEQVDETEDGNTPDDEEVNEIMNSIVNNKRDDINDQPSTNSSSFRQKAPKGKKKKKTTKGKKAGKWEVKEIDQLMREATGKSSSEISVTVPNAVPMSRSTNPFSTGLKLEDMKKLSNAPRMIKDWSNDEIILFLRGWNEFSFEQIHSMIPDRWVLYSSMWATQKKLKEEAERRNLRITKDPLRRPMSEWTDKDLQGYLNVMNNHRFDSDFQLKYTGFESMNDCNQLTYKVKKELQSRKLLA